MGGQPKEPFGTGGYGVTYTSGNKGQPALPQIDPSQALAYYAQSGQTMSAGIAAGNTAYQAALKQAASQMNTGYAAADATLAPLSSASTQALTLFQQMMGITPQSTTATYGNSLLQIDPTLTNIAGMINSANSAQDPTQRATYQQQITQQLQSSGAGGVTAAQAALSGLVAPNMQQDLQNAAQREVNGENNPTTTTGLIPRATALSMAMTDVNAQGSVTAQYKSELAKYNSQQTADQSNLSDAQLKQQELNQFSSNFNQAYTPDYKAAFTGDQVAQKIQATPGYQFQLDQGDQQIMRNQAAVGNLGTGGTQVALDNYGQNYAQNAYNGYMGNLQSLINNGTGATSQLAANQANQYGYLANLTNLGGQAQNAASTAEGQAVGNSQAQMGATAYNAAALNTQLQYDAWAVNQNASAQSQANAMQLAGNAMNSQNQNASGAGFYQGMNAQMSNASNNTYNMAGSSGGNSGSVGAATISNGGQSSGNV